MLLDNIEREKAQIDYYCANEDREILCALFEEISKYAGVTIRYLAEIDAFRINGAGRIIAQYITKFSSETVKAYLIPQLVSEKIEDCDSLLLQLYLKFKSSKEYISKPGIPAPAHIYVRFDNGFRTLKPKRLTGELTKLTYNPRDVFYLPFTTKMLASWKIPELEELLILYSSDSNIAAKDVGLPEDENAYLPPLSFIKRELRFIAIDGLKYYPSNSTSVLIRQYTADDDPDIRDAAKRTLRTIKKKMGDNS